MRVSLGQLIPVCPCQAAGGAEEEAEHVTERQAGHQGLDKPTSNYA